MTDRGRCLTAMVQITVYNPSVGPVVIDNARTLDGSRWSTVTKTHLVDDLIKQGLLLAKSVDSPAKDSAVSSETTGESETAKPETDASKSRRRKPPVKE